MAERPLFSSESVTEGHPDKLADRISDSVLDAILAQDRDARVACETSTTTGLVLVFALLATANSGGYRYGVGDQAFYIPATELRLTPDAFPRDRALIASQARLTIVDEALAARYPFPEHPLNGAWPEIRRADGTVIRP